MNLSTHVSRQDHNAGNFHRRPPDPLADEIRDHILTLNRNGMAPVAIAEKLRTDVRIITNILRWAQPEQLTNVQVTRRDLGLPVDPWKLPRSGKGGVMHSRETMARAVELVADKKISAEDLGRLLAVPTAQVVKWCNLIRKRSLPKDKRPQTAQTDSKSAKPKTNPTPAPDPKQPEAYKDPYEKRTQRIMSLHRRGHSRTEIGEEIGISDTIVSYVIREQECRAKLGPEKIAQMRQELGFVDPDTLPRRTRGGADGSVLYLPAWPTEDIYRLCILMDAGKVTLEEASCVMGVSMMNIANWRSQRNTTLARQAVDQASARAKAPEPPLEPAVELPPVEVSVKPVAAAAAPTPEPTPVKETPVAAPAPAPTPAPAPAPIAETAPDSSGGIMVIRLRSGGEVTLAASVNLFSLRGEDRKFVFALIDQMNQYAEGEAR